MGIVILTLLLGVLGSILANELSAWTPHIAYFWKTLDLRGKVAYDIGAFHGLLAMHLARQARTVVAWEPTSHNRRSGRTRERHPDWFLEMHGADPADKRKRVEAIVHHLWRLGYRNISHVERPRSSVRSVPLGELLAALTGCDTL